ncbi:MAG: FAD-dependent oxidoreductase [Bacteroidetes bacterium]|nr:FAD-dependent oxidoreductase [Bacteroidota bacterium]
MGIIGGRYAINQEICNMSFWNSFIHPKYDAFIIGAGFTGLRTAILLQLKHPEWNVKVVDALPVGALASTRNAGFGCFGSPGEILSDLEKGGERDVVRLIQSRFRGIQKLQQIGGIDVEIEGGYEVFIPEKESEFRRIEKSLPELNRLLKEVTGSDQTYLVKDISGFKMNFLQSAFYTPFEFQLNPGLLYRKLLEDSNRLGIDVQYSVEITNYSKSNTGWEMNFGHISFQSQRLIICSNGNTSKLLEQSEISPARGQIILTQPIKELPLKGNFHSHEGYYYFRNVGNRMLIGGARHLDISGETTTELETSEIIMNHLQSFTSRYILPQNSWSIDTSWAGIMGRRSGKGPLIKELDTNLWVGAGLSGMGVALSESVAEQLAELVLSNYSQ